jgi:hypothetical protein
MEVRFLNANLAAIRREMNQAGDRFATSPASPLLSKYELDPSDSLSLDVPVLIL